MTSSIAITRTMVKGTLGKALLKNERRIHSDGWQPFSHELYGSILEANADAMRLFRGMVSSSKHLIA